MEKDSKIYVAGHTGLLGSAIVRALNGAGYYNIITASHGDFDLTNQEKVFQLFELNRPEYVFMSAAKVGSIAENIKYPVEFLSENILIQKNVFEATRAFKVKKLLFFSSNCCYPRDCKQPMSEEYLMTGPLEPTNESYSLAKIIGMKLCKSYNSQYGTKFHCMIPASMYGPNGHFGTSRAHVVADMMQKLYRAKEVDLKEITFWGDGSPLREFMFVNDVADAALFLMNNNSLVIGGEAPSFINIGTGEEISMFDLSLLIARTVGYGGKISWDTSKPNGMPRKLLDSSRFYTLGWRHKTELEAGIRKTYECYLKNRDIN